MRPLKSFLASTLAAAATLGLAAISTPTQACTLCGGVKLNGVRLNGLTWNGLQFNCIKWNGMKINGIQFNGAQQAGTGNEAATVRVLAVTLPH